MKMTRTEFDSHVEKIGCNPYFWLEALETLNFSTPGERKEKAQQRAIAQLKMFIDSLYPSQDTN